MTGDFWTKPLQGALFRRFRDLIMGVIPQPEPRGEKPSKTKLKDPNTDGKKTNPVSAGACWKTAISLHVALRGGHRWRASQPPSKMTQHLAWLHLHGDTSAIGSLLASCNKRLLGLLPVEE